MQGLQRTYTAYLPSNFDPSLRYPVVMMLHGGLGDGAKIDQQTGLSSHVDSSGFVAVFPDSGGGQWNDGRETTRSFRDDLGFLTTLVKEIVAKWGGDSSRVFVGGASNGGMMVQRLACETTNVFAAYAVALANMPRALAATCRPADPARIVFFQSTTDPLMPWVGGEVKQGRLSGVGGRVLSTPETIAFWSRVDGCSGAQTRDIPDRGNDGTHVRLHDYGACGLMLYEVQGGGHTWPGSDAPRGIVAQRILGKATREIEATVAMLAFFRRFGL